MSERPKWMPSVTDVQEQSDLHLGWADDEAMDFIYHVGLRAQIAVLEEMQAALFKFNGGPACYFEVDWLAEKVAALRKELGE